MELKVFEIMEITLCCPPRKRCPKAKFHPENGVIIVSDEEQNIPGQLKLTPEQIQLLADFTKKMLEENNSDKLSAS